MSATHQLRTAHGGKGRGKATKDRILVSDRGFFWQPFIDLRTAVTVEIGFDLDWIEANSPAIHKRLLEIEGRLVFDTAPRSILPVLEDIRDWTTLMMVAISKRRELRPE